MREIAQFTHNEAVRHSFVLHFLDDPHHHQLPFLQASNRNADYTPSWETAPSADIIQRSVCIVRWIDTREVTGIYNIKWWNPLHLCNGYDRVGKIFATKVHVCKVLEKKACFLSFSASPFTSLSPTISCSLPASPRISHPLFCASGLMCGMTACQWSDLFPKQHCERLSMHFVLNCFNEAVEINLRASRSRPPDIVF